jgi:hypothetical protein
MHAKANTNLDGRATKHVAQIQFKWYRRSITSAVAVHRNREIAQRCRLYRRERSSGSLSKLLMCLDKCRPIGFCFLTVDTSTLIGRLSLVPRNWCQEIAAAKISHSDHIEVDKHSSPRQSKS